MSEKTKFKCPHRHLQHQHHHHHQQHQQDKTKTTAVPLPLPLPLLLLLLLLLYDYYYVYDYATIIVQIDNYKQVISPFLLTIQHPLYVPVIRRCVAVLPSPVNGELNHTYWSSCHATLRGPRDDVIADVTRVRELGYAAGASVEVARAAAVDGLSNRLLILVLVLIMYCSFN